jgi:hypothetical protein
MMTFIDDMVPFGFIIVGIFLFWFIMELQIYREKRRRRGHDE